jgi:GrpB-like predicted nucleotidyltransferase (UPF0157 family)
MRPDATEDVVAALAKVGARSSCFGAVLLATTDANDDGDEDEDGYQSHHHNGGQTTAVLAARPETQQHMPSQMHLVSHSDTASQKSCVLRGSLEERPRVARYRRTTNFRAAKYTAANKASPTRPPTIATITAIAHTS